MLLGAPDEEAGVERTVELVNGDFYRNLSIAGTGTEKSAELALDFYQQAFPSPRAYRNAGLIKETILQQSGLHYLYEIDSPEATKGLSAAQVRELSDEVTMWRDMFVNANVDAARVEDFKSRIEDLQVGPLGELALAEMYSRMGQAEKAKTHRLAAQRIGSAWLVKVAVFGAVLIVSVVAGLVVLAIFIFKHAGSLSARTRKTIQPSVLLLTFLVYLAANLGLDVVGETIFRLAGLDSAGGMGEVIWLGVRGVFLLGGVALGLSALLWITSYTREDFREIGLKPTSFTRALQWGLAGVCAALPLVLIGFVVTQMLMNTVFKNVYTPESPLHPMIMGSGTAAFVIVFVLAVVVAPLIEETFFRGTLFNSLRGAMGVWPAVWLSGAIFALVHPFPTHFLPILALGAVLAIIREKTGSLVPCMVCHGVYNSIVMIYALVIT